MRDDDDDDYTPAGDPGEPFGLDFTQALYDQLNNRQAKLIGPDSEKEPERIVRIASRKQIEQAFLDTFEMIGGVPRLAIWANDPKNYKVFLNLLAKLFPKGLEDKGDQGQVFQYLSNVPQSPLNRQSPPPEIAEGVYEEVGNGDS